MGDHQTHDKLWRRSDALAKGWILGSLSKETHRYVLDRLTEKPHQERNSTYDFCAKDVWDELQTMYAPAVLPQLLVVGTYNLFLLNFSELVIHIILTIKTSTSYMKKDIWLLQYNH